MIFNSIVLAYRNRPQHLKWFLQSLQISHAHSSNKDIELSMVDLGSDKSSEKLIEKYLPKENIKYTYIDYKKTFCKSKALNKAIIQSSGIYITVLDVDAVMPPKFLDTIYKIYKEAGDVKLSYRMYMTTNYVRQKLMQSGISEDFINKNLVESKTNWPIADERYTKSGVNFKDAKATAKKFVAKEDTLSGMTYLDQAWGNSQFTIKKDLFFTIGGYDERFIGHGYEDTDFNRRAYSNLNNGGIITDRRSCLYHIYHDKKADWANLPNQMKNKRIYELNKRNRKAININRLGLF